MKIVLFILFGVLLLGIILLIVSLITLGRILKAVESFYDEIEKSNE